jgi:hypothetical protein
MATVQQWWPKHVAFGVVATFSIIAARWRTDDSAAALGPGRAVAVVGAFGCEHVIAREADSLPARGRAIRR